MLDLLSELLPNILEIIANWGRQSEMVRVSHLGKYGDLGKTA